MLRINISKLSFITENRGTRPRENTTFFFAKKLFLWEAGDLLKCRSLDKPNIPGAGGKYWE